MARIKQTERQQTIDQTRQRLLAAASNEFATVGYEKANVNTISLAAGYAKGTIYNYFPSKQALLLALIDDIAQLHLDFMHQSVLQITDPAQRLERFYQAGFEFVTLYPSQARAMFNTLSSADEASKQHAFEAYQPMFQFVAAEILAPGLTQGLFRDIEPVSMSTLLMTIYLGTATHLSPQGEFRLDPNQVAALALHGILKSPGV
jgi:AcrR family transcriptional regulator